jgi:hypothetical protein
LQAADVVAWTKRRRTAGKPLRADFEVLTQLFEGDHTEAPITHDILRSTDEHCSPHLLDEGWSKGQPAGK